MITITVQGERGEGKTVTALRIVAYLRSLGFETEYEGPLPWDWEEFLAHPIVGSEPRLFMVRDDP